MGIDNVAFAEANEGRLGGEGRREGEGRGHGGEDDNDIEAKDDYDVRAKHRNTSMP